MLALAHSQSQMEPNYGTPSMWCQPSGFQGVTGFQDLDVAAQCWADLAQLPVVDQRPPGSLQSHHMQLLSYALLCQQHSSAVLDILLGELLQAGDGGP